MRRDLSLRLCLSAAGLALMTTACEVRLQDPVANEREVIELESWSQSPGSSTYSFAKCASSNDISTSALHTVCGTKLGENSGTNYNWQTNCMGQACGTVSVFAHYMLPENLGAGETLRIEAFNNSQFSGAPVSSLEIQGFDASKPSSSDREEIFLAPGEYYFRAYLSPRGSAPIPYSLQGMELVSDTPIGILGALSGAQRVIVKSVTQPVDTVHIYINQLFKKPVPAEDSFAKIRIEISTSEILKATLEKYRDVHILLLKEPDLELKPSYDFTLSSTSLIVDSPWTSFVSPSVEPAEYYVFAFVDANGNRYFDESESGSYVVDEDGKPEGVTIEKNRTRGLKIELK